VKTLDLVFCRGISGGTRVKRFVEGQDRAQLMLLPECLDDSVGEDNPVRVVDAFIEELDLAVLGFAGVVPEATGRPSYHPATRLKIYLNGYLNQVQSSRRLGPKTQLDYKGLPIFWAGLSTRPPPRMSIAIGCGWRRSRRR
jgi:hypothetical protein